MRVAILTGGGDVPGLNSCIKAVTQDAVRLGWEVIGFRRGWAGPLHYDPDHPEDSEGHLLRLTPERVRTIDRFGGTILHTSRTNPAAVGLEDLPPFLIGKLSAKEGRFDATSHILRVLGFLQIDTLIVIGGDDTLSYAVQLHRRGVSVMAIPKTMDNDVFGTDYCIGFSTAVSRSVELVQRLRTPSGSHERIAVIELFGRNCGETALMTGYLADADRTLIAEVPFEMQRLADLLARDRTNNPSNYAILVLSEGARFEGAEPLEAGPQDAYGHRKLGGLGERVGAAITRATGIDVLVQRLGYLMRAGPPDTLDQMVARNFGAMAMQHLADGKRGLMMALRAGIYTAVPIESCVQGVRRVDVRALYDIEAYRPRIDGVMRKPMFLF